MPADLNHGLNITYERLPKPIRGIEVYVGRSHGKIVDIRVPLNEAQNYHLLTHNDNKQRRWQTSCYTYIFQSELAGFEQKCFAHPELKSNGIEALSRDLRSWSEQYAVFEAMINQPPQGLTRESLSVVYTQLRQLKERMPVGMQAKLMPTLNSFERNLLSLYNKPRRGEPLSKGDIRRFFSMQQEDPKTPCLGKFLAEQMTALAEYGADKVYEITDENPSNKLWNRFKQLFAMHPLLKHLSDAAANIEQKGLSLYGARFINSRDPIPSEMLKAIGPKPADKQPPETQWTSLTPYLERPDDLEEIDALFSHIGTGNQAQTTTPPAHQTWWERFKDRGAYWGRQSGVFFANVIELPFALALRLAPSLILAVLVVALRLVPDALISIFAVFIPKEEKRTQAWRRSLDTGVPRVVYYLPAFAVKVMSAVLWPIAIKPLMGMFGYTRKERNERWESFSTGLNRFDKDPLTFFDQSFSSAHQSVSPVIRAKKWRNDGLTDVDPELQNETTFNQPVSQYDVLLGELNPTHIGNFFTTGIDTMMKTVFSPFKLIIDAGKSIWGQLTVERTDKTISRKQAYNAKIFEQYQAQATNEALEHYAKELAKASSVPINNKTLPKAERFRNSLKPWEMNEISSPLDFLDEIFVGLSDVVIGPMFRKSPGLATAFFVFANVSLAGLMFPALSSAEATSWLKWLPKQLSEGFMGKHAGLHESSINKLFAVFLQWKITFFAAEGTMELAHGDMDFLKAMLHHPEKITLATGVMVAMGLAMNWMPEIDPENKIPLHKLSGGQLENIHFTNYYIEALNLFSHEAKEVTEFGTPPLTGIEYAFLSLKSIFLVEDMMSGGHRGHSPDVTAILGQEQRDPIKTIIERIHTLHAQHYPTKTLDQILHEENLGEERIKTQLIRPAIIQYCDKSKPKIKLNEEKLEGCITFFFDNLKEAVKLAKETQIQSEKNKQEMAQSLTKLEDLRAAEPPHRKKLREAIETVERMEITGKGFDSEADASAFYDYLYQTFKDYNNEQRKLGRWDQQIDKENFLHAFYNKHIYKGSNNFLRLVSIFPLYPLTLLWRGIQSFSNSPATQYKLKRSFRKDGVMGLQSLAMGGRVGHEVVRAYTYGFIGVAATAIFLLTIPLYVQSLWRVGVASMTNQPVPTTPTWQQRIMNSVIEGLSLVAQVSPYHLEGSASTKAKYSRFAKMTGTGSEHLKSAGLEIKNQLLEHSTSNTGTPLLQGYARKHEKGISDNKAERRAEKALLTAYAEFETQIDRLQKRFDTLPSSYQTAIQNAGYAEHLPKAKSALSEFKTAGQFKLPNDKQGITRALDKMEDQKILLDQLEEVIQGQEKRIARGQKQ